MEALSLIEQTTKIEKTEKGKIRLTTDINTFYQLSRMIEYLSEISGAGLDEDHELINELFIEKIKDGGPRQHLHCYVLKNMNRAIRVLAENSELNSNLFQVIHDWQKLEESESPN